MKKLVLFLLSPLFCLSSTHASRLTDGKVKSQLEKDKITISVEKGYHINIEAPISLKFYICDDKKTVCEQHEIKNPSKK